MQIKIKKILIFSLVALLLLSVFVFSYILNLKSGVKDSVLRLHIVGASDSEYDQQLKICVRDKILSEFDQILQSLPDKTAAVNWASDNADEICRVAKNELESHGCYLPVFVEVKNTEFPTKTYGSIALPRGTYTALNIKIGEASGQNWWCVMYPPLCVTDKTAEITDKSKQYLKDNLSRGEYDLISENPTIKIKFRIAELLN